MTSGFRSAIAVAAIAFASSPAFAHRLDEYLQAALVSVGKAQVRIEMTLTPGVAVFPRVMAEMDADASGAVSEAEQHAYAENVLRDLSLAIDGRPLAPQLVSLQFPAVDEMREGRGEIELNLTADLPRGGRNRKLTLENHHLRGISVYMVNAVVPRDRAIQITAQQRNPAQSVYELDYLDAGAAQDVSASAWPLRLVCVSGLLILLTWVMLGRLPLARQFKAKMVITDGSTHDFVPK